MTANQKTAKKIQEYILENSQKNLQVADIALAVGYSPRHCTRVFKQVTGHTIPEYLRLLRLTEAAKQLLAGGSVLDTALDKGYATHEGFTKAFVSAFGVTPSRYRKGGAPIPWFIPYPVVLPETEKTGEKPMYKSNENTPKTVTATYVDKPARKLAFLPAKRAVDYFSYCEEVGCEWEGLLASIPESLDLPALVTLHPAAVPAGYAACAGGIELPAGYAGELPTGCVVIDLPAGTMLDLRTAPYENEEDYIDEIEAVMAAYQTYSPREYGYEYAPTEAPLFNFGAPTKVGARLALPVQKI